LHYGSNGGNSLGRRMPGRRRERQSLYVTGLLGLGGNKVGRATKQTYFACACQASLAADGDLVLKCVMLQGVSPPKPIKSFNKQVSTPPTPTPHPQHQGLTSTVAVVRIGELTCAIGRMHSYGVLSKMIHSSAGVV